MYLHKFTSKKIPEEDTQSRMPEYSKPKYFLFSADLVDVISTESKHVTVLFHYILM